MWLTGTTLLLLLRQGMQNVAKQNFKKKFKTLPRVLNYKLEQDILKESFDDFKDRVSQMPICMLLQEHRHIAEQYGIVIAQSGTDWGEKHQAIFKRLSHVNELILKMYHAVLDQVAISDYYNDLAWKEVDKKEKNVKVFKKFDKQN
jgi:hypothetical protein